VITGVLAAATIAVPKVNYTTILPELILLGGMLLLLGVSALVSRPIPTEAYATTTGLIGLASLIASLVLWHDVQHGGAFQAIARSIDVDGFAAFGLVLVSCIVILGAFFAAGYLRREGVVGPEYYALALISGSGAMFMASANDLILIFLGLEILSIPLYVMAGFDRRREESAESAMKYFVLGAFSSAIFVYGIALTYGATGSTNLAQIAAFLSRNIVVNDGVLMGGLALLIVGFGFKVAAVPFHMWTPDVYAGAPTPAVGFMAAVAKVGGFMALIRVLISTMPTMASTWQPALWVIAAATLLLGAVVALAQRDIKRMLAYSSINHAGFILIGVQAGTISGSQGALYYLFAYSLLTIGSFAVVTVVAGRGDERNDLDNYRGLAKRSPFLAGCFAILLLGQAGAPFTTGFFAKFYVIEASVSAHSYALAVIAMLSAGIAVFFYLRVVLTMFSDAKEAGLDLPAEDVAGTASGSTALAARVDVTQVLAVSPWTATGLVFVVGATLVLGVWPQPLVSFAHQASLLFH
jgi:NADH-quinone oxidoreductase subunit N